MNFSVAIPAAIYRSAQGPGPESAPRSAFRRSKRAQKTLKKHSLGTPSQVPKCTQKVLRGALSGPGLLADL